MADLIDVKRSPVAEVVGKLRSSSRGESTEAGQTLVRLAADHGVSLRDYLTLAVDPRQGEDSRRYEGLNGYEATLAYLNLPFQNDLEQGVLLQAAAETFQVYPGTRAMFPEVVDDMLRFKGRQDQIENVAALVAQSRTINGVEMVSTFVEDDKDERGTYSVAELGRIPVRTVRTSQTSVGMFKHGSGYRTSYEFNRRSSLDILTPFAARVARELEISKVKNATAVLLNGDGVNGAATADALASYGADFTGGKTLKDNYRALATFLMKRAQAGNPVDTIVGNFDMFIELMFMFQPNTANSANVAKEMIAMGTPGVNLSLPLLNGSVNFALSSAMPANYLLAFSKAETLEELVEAGSSISENEKSILNQSITYVRSEVTGYKLAFGDTRTLLKCVA